MQKKRVVSFLILYAAIIAAMLFVFLVIQARYGVEPGCPSKRRFFDKFFLEAPSHHAPVLAYLDARDGFGGMILKKLNFSHRPGVNINT